MTLVSANLTPQVSTTIAHQQQRLQAAGEQNTAALQTLASSSLEQITQLATRRNAITTAMAEREKQHFAEMEALQKKHNIKLKSLFENLNDLEQAILTLRKITFNHIHDMASPVPPVGYCPDSVYIGPASSRIYAIPEYTPTAINAQPLPVNRCLIQ